MYIPDSPNPQYHDLVGSLYRELTYAFGGASLLQGLSGSYLSQNGCQMRDRISLIYTDTRFVFDDHYALVSDYADELRKAAFEALAEEAVLVVAYRVYHSE